MRARATDLRTTTPDAAPMLRHFEQHLRRVIARARAHADRVIVVRQPWFAQARTAEELALMWHGGMRILDKIAAMGSRLFAERPQLNSFDKAVVLARSVAWRGETLPPRALHLANRILDRRAR